MKNTLLLLLVYSLSFAQDKQVIVRAFDAAAVEFGVPSDVLKGVAFAETRWDQLTWAEGDTASACTGMPRPYGIMSLWDNQYFGHSLVDAAALIGKDPSVLKNDVVQNIRGAAALLKKYHDELPLPEGTSAGDIESWRNAIAAYSGLPQAELAQQHALDIYSQMSVGYHQYHIDWDARPVNLGPMRAAVAKIQSDAKAAKLFKGTSGTTITNQPDYPLALWAQAYPGHWNTSGSTRSFVVIHDMEGYYLSTISYFQMSTTQASAHYCVNSGYQPDGRPGGEITQMVEEKYWAWHVRQWNSYMFGIEHEGFVNNAAWYTDDMYKSSALLTNYLCKKYNIPMDRNHIIAHGEWQNQAWRTWMTTNFPQIDLNSNDHTDPGSNWNWDYYMNLVRVVNVASTFPAKGAVNVPCYRSIDVQFSVEMDTASVRSAFSLVPAVSGTFNWANGNSTLSFKPDQYLAFSTTYTLTIDSTAKDAIGARYLDGLGSGQGPSQFQMSFTTIPPDVTPPAITSYYPHATTTNFPVTGSVLIRYDEPLLLTSPGSLIQIKDSTGATITPVAIKVSSDADAGAVYVSSTQFRQNAKYTVEVSPGITDFYGNAASTGLSFGFTAGPDVVTEGTVFDTFDGNVRLWTPPNQNSASALIDANATQFVFVSDELKAGTKSGKLVYKYSQSQGGLVVLQPGTGPTLDSYSSFGVWVFGDDSRNVLQLVFQPQNQIGRSDTIDWVGWKFIGLPLSNITGPSKRFSSAVIRQVGGGSPSGTLYFDNMQVNPVLSGVETMRSAYPTGYALAQNYPNPFNPSTVVRYQVPKESHVRLSVCNILGQVVETLVDEEKSPGYYSSTFNASRLSSGVYFCRMEAPGFQQVQKMLLVR